MPLTRDQALQQLHAWTTNPSSLSHIQWCDRRLEAPCRRVWDWGQEVVGDTEDSHGYIKTSILPPRRRPRLIRKSR